LFIFHVLVFPEFDLVYILFYAESSRVKTGFVSIFRVGSRHGISIRRNPANRARIPPLNEIRKIFVRFIFYPCI